MNTPGYSIDFETYDDNLWRSKNYEGADPDLLKFEMTDMIPDKASYFVDSGRKVSIMWKRFLMNYINPRANESLAEETTEYRSALSRIFKEDYTTTELVKTVEATRNTAKETLNRVANVRAECLRNEAAGVCAQKMLYYQAEVDDNNLLYMVTRKELQGAEATVLALQSRNVDNIIAQGMQKFFSGARSGVGGSTLFGAYMLTRYDPSDFYNWWHPTPETASKTFKAAWTGVSIVSSSGSSTESSSTQKRSFGAAASYNAGMFKASGSFRRSTDNSQMDATANGQTVKIQFQLAQVRVYRTWLDPSLLEYYPLGLESTTVNEWSDGNYNGLFPWYISKVIVAKNITVSMSQFSSQISESLSSASTDASMSLSYGPFSMSARYSNTNSQKDRAESFKTSGASIMIDGPQVIGYVVSKFPVL